MQEKQMQAPGGWAATVCVPDGMPVPDVVTVQVRPKTVEEFEAVMESLGGVGAFRFPRDGGYWDNPAFSGDGSGLHVMLYPPPQKVAGVDATVRAHPFFGAYAARAAVRP